MVIIEAVVPGSLAEEQGIRPGDALLRINDRVMTDLIDVHRALEADDLVVEILRGDEALRLVCRKVPEEDLGLVLEHPQPQQCGNQCQFCFVHQLPRGLRRSLYIKDEDYRFSWLYGSYVTLTNLTEQDLERITGEKLSPLYISVHATDPVVRDRLLGCQAPPIWPLLQRLAQAQIAMHCQIVLCPGINDGPVLRQTLDDLASLVPQVASVAVVPVGLTGHRKRLPRLVEVGREEARACLDLIEDFQQQFLESRAQRLIYAADEFYLLAEREFPALNAYDDLPQWENGVGMLPLFRSQAEEVLLEAEPLDLDAAILVTGQLFRPELEVFAQRLSLRTDVAIEVMAVDNVLFGASVTVAGLISGRDVLARLRDVTKGRGVVIPDVMVTQDSQVFLDDVSIEDIRRALQVPVEVVETSAWGVLEGLERLADGSVDIIRC